MRRFGISPCWTRDIDWARRPPPLPLLPPLASCEKRHFLPRWHVPDAKNLHGGAPTVAAFTAASTGTAEPPDVTEFRADHTPADQPDPVTLCHPTHDSDGLLRWASATFDLLR